MRRFALYLRSIVEGAAAFFILLMVPFLGIDILHGNAGTANSLVSFFILCILFLLGLLLFRDAIRLRLRLQKEKNQ